MNNVEVKLQLDTDSASTIINGKTLENIGEPTLAKTKSHMLRLKEKLFLM